MRSFCLSAFVCVCPCIEFAEYLQLWFHNINDRNTKMYTNYTANIIEQITKKMYFSRYYCYYYCKLKCIDKKYYFTIVRVTGCS